MLSIQGRIAQSVKRGTINPKGVGSSPSMGVSFYSILTFVIVKLRLKFLFGSDDTIEQPKFFTDVLIFLFKGFMCYALFFFKIK